MHPEQDLQQHLQSQENNSPLKAQPGWPHCLVIARLQQEVVSCWKALQNWTNHRKPTANVLDL